MNPEPLRIRVLDALELAPATVEQLALLLSSKRSSLRAVCRDLELQELVEMIDTKPPRNAHGRGRVWKVYALRPTARRIPTKHLEAS